MGKLQNLTVEIFQDTISRAEDLLSILNGIEYRLEKDYCDDLDEPIRIARTLVALTGTAARVASLLLHKSAMDEISRAILSAKGGKQ
jgi:hypothetical protein